MNWGGQMTEQEGDLSLFKYASGEVTTNDYYTPKWLFDAMGVSFDIDVAAPPSGIPWIPAKKWFSQVDDGLAQNWGGAFVWMNPPFSHVTPWARKFIENNNGLALMVVSRSKWFEELWECSDAIMATPKDLKFMRPNENPKAISFQTFLFALGSQGVQALKNTKLARVR
jgi:hypothetical protein